METPEFFEEIECGDAASFLYGLNELTRSRDLAGYIFRGHADDTYELVPSALRSLSRDKLVMATGIPAPNQDQIDWNFWQVHMESQALRRFYKWSDRRGLYLPHVEDIRDSFNEWFDSNSVVIGGPARRWLPKEYLELAGLAQHYGVPTRLLDWTYSPMVAAYFASLTEPSDGFISIWCLNMSILQTDRLSVGGAPIEFITPFYGGNPNLAAQEGLFTHWIIPRPEGLRQVSGNIQIDETCADRTPLDALLRAKFEERGGRITHNVLLKFKLAKRNSMHLRELVRRSGYGPARLFPGYAGVVKEMFQEPILP